MSYKLKLLSVTSWSSWAQLPSASSRRNVVHLVKSLPGAKDGENKTAIERDFKKALSSSGHPKKLELNNFSVVAKNALVSKEVVTEGGVKGADESVPTGLVEISFTLDGGRLFVSDRIDSNVQGNGFLANVLKGVSGQSGRTEHFHLTWPPFDCVGLPVQDESNFVIALSRLISEHAKGVALSFFVTFGPNARKLFDVLTSESGLRMTDLQCPKLIEFPSIDSVVVSEAKKKEVWDRLKFMRQKDRA